MWRMLAFHFKRWSVVVSVLCLSHQMFYFVILTSLKWMKTLYFLCEVLWYIDLKQPQELINLHTPMFQLWLLEIKQPYYECKLSNPLLNCIKYLEHMASLRFPMVVCAICKWQLLSHRFIENLFKHLRGPISIFLLMAR